MKGGFRILTARCVASGLLGAAIRRSRPCRAGSILLEMVIVVPLFMMLIGGMLWIGDLTVTKQKLVIADRYAAWNRGNRYRPGISAATLQSEVQTGFFPGDANKAVSIATASGNVPRWSHAAYAGVTAQVEMPLWTHGWVAAGDAAWGSTMGVSNSVSVRGRDIANGPSGFYEGHLVVMRSGVFARRGGNQVTPNAPLVLDTINAAETEAWADEYVSLRVP